MPIDFFGPYDEIPKSWFLTKARFPGAVSGHEPASQLNPFSRRTPWGPFLETP